MKEISKILGKCLVFAFLALVPQQAEGRDWLGSVVERVLFPGGYATPSSSGSSYNYHYYICDYQGNVRAVVDGIGTLEERNSYYPYGMLMPAEADGALPAEQPYKWSGKEYLTIHGINLYDFGPRALFSPLGIFTQPDPECESYPGISPYTYCAGNPVNLVDPTGKDVAILNYTDGMHLAILIQDKDDKWYYYSINGDNQYIPVVNVHIGGRTFDDIKVGVNGRVDSKSEGWESPQDFLDSEYNKRDGNTKNDKRYSNYDFKEAYQISTTKEQDETIKGAFIDISKTEYRLTSNNCATAVQDALIEGGVPISKTITVPLSKIFETSSGSIQVKIEIRNTRTVFPGKAFKSIMEANPQGVYYRKSK